MKVSIAYFNPDDPSQAWTDWDTLELHPIRTDGTSAHQLGLYIEVTRHFLMHRLCDCGHTTRAIAWRAKNDSLWKLVDIRELFFKNNMLPSVYFDNRVKTA
jgi:hypothetical protein